MLSDYDDDTQPREVPNGPYFVSPSLRLVQRAQMMRAAAQVDARGYTLAKTEPCVLKMRSGMTDVERRAAVERTKHLSVIGAAAVLGLNRETVRQWRKRFGGAS